MAGLLGHNGQRGQWCCSGSFSERVVDQDTGPMDGSELARPRAASGRGSAIDWRVHVSLPLACSPCFVDRPDDGTAR